jgi:mycothiol synthase
MTNFLGFRTKSVPEGLTLRRYAGFSDLVEFVRLENAESMADNIPERTTIDKLRVAFSNPNDVFDPIRDITVATIGDKVVGYSERNWVDTSDGELREYRLHGVVDPAWRRRGIGTALLLDSEQRTRDLVAAQNPSRPCVFGSWGADSQIGDFALLRANGYEPVRYFFDMVRRTMDDIPDLPIPDGLEVRPITPDLYRQVWDADLEAFHDHWGGHDASEEAFQRWISRPTFDPSLWVIAFDGDEVAGGVMNSIDDEENEALGIKRGWLASVWTRRQWRRRGLAKAAIGRSLAIHRDRGMTTAGLGVDADNPSGALGLYEDMGFEVDFRSTAWRKPL